MARWGSCDFSAFRALSNRFRQTADAQASKQVMREVLQELGNLLLDDTKNRTPVDTGNLRRMWFITSVRQRGELFEIEIYNNTEYASWVENGHRIVNHGRTVGWCEGFYAAIKTDETRTLDFSGVRGFLVTNVCIVQRSAP